MAITYSTTVASARLSAVVTAIGTSGKLEILNSGGTVLATIALANPAGSVTNRVLTFTMPQSDATPDAEGEAAAARIRTGADADVVTGLTVGTSGTDIVLDTLDITTAVPVTISSATITHP